MIYCYQWVKFCKYHFEYDSYKILVCTTFIHRMFYELQHLIVTTLNININLKYHISILLLQLIKVL